MVTPDILTEMLNPFFEVSKLQIAPWEFASYAGKPQELFNRSLLGRPPYLYVIVTSKIGLMPRNGISTRWHS